MARTSCGLDLLCSDFLWLGPPVARTSCVWTYCGSELLISSTQEVRGRSQGRDSRYKNDTAGATQIIWWRQNMIQGHRRSIGCTIDPPADLMCQVHTVGPPWTRYGPPGFYPLSMHLLSSYSHKTYHQIFFQKIVISMYYIELHAHKQIPLLYIAIPEIPTNCYFLSVTMLNYMYLLTYSKSQEMNFVTKFR